MTAVEGFILAMIVFSHLSNKMDNQKLELETKIKINETIDMIEEVENEG